MINASKEFKEKLKKGAKLLNYADLTLNNGTKVHLEPEDFMVGGCQIEDKTTDGKFGVGYAIGKTVTLRIANHDERFSDYDFYSSVINLYVAAQLDDGTIEMIRKGVYYTTVPQTPGDVIEISAVDSMYRLDRDYSESNTVYPATLQTIITEACMDCGIPIGFRQFDNMDFVVAAKPENAKYRQVVSYACQIAGYNAHIDNDGYMQLVWYDTSLLDKRQYDGGDFKVWPHDTILDGGDFTYSTPTMVIDGGSFTDPAPENIYQIKNLNVSTDDIVITGVQVVGEEDEAAAGESGYMIKLENNPFVNGKEKEVAAYLGARMIGLVFRAFSADVLNNPLYEPFEVARVYDRKGNGYLTIINSVSYTVGGYTQIACEAEDPIRNGSSFYSASAAAVAEARRNTKKQITEYDKAVQNMNQIAMNAMGFHTTYEDKPDGSRITYLHDKPNLSDSKTVYKQSIDGFFVSQDGGKSYTAGFDKNGTAVVNILYAIGIVADWIRSGRFECRKGSTITFLADVDTGQVIINAESVSISGKSVADIAQGKVDAQTQQSVFNKLTNNGQAQGLYLQNGQLYMLFTYAKGGTLTLGGVNNTNGSMRILNAAGEQIGYWDNRGIYAANGSFTGAITSSSAVITGGTIRLSAGGGWDSVITLEDGNRVSTFTGGTIQVGDGSHKTVLYPNQIESIVVQGEKIYATDYLQVNGSAKIINDFEVFGTKNRRVKTSYGDALLYCYETAAPMFGDVGCGKLDGDGLCYIFFDPVFAETIAVGQYQVFLQKEGAGDIWVEAKTQEYFLAKGTPGLAFSWETKAKQAEYELYRLEAPREPEESEPDYEFSAQQYLENYEKEIMAYENSNQFYAP